MNRMRKAAAVIVMLCMLLTLLPSLAVAEDVGVRTGAGCRIIQSGYQNGILTVKVQVKDPDASGISTIIAITTYDPTALKVIDFDKNSAVEATDTTKKYTSNEVYVSKALATNTRGGVYEFSEQMLYGTAERAAIYTAMSKMTANPNNNQKTTDWVDAYEMQFEVTGKPAALTDVLYSDSIRFADVSTKEDKVLLDACDSDFNSVAGVALTTIGTGGKSGVFVYNGIDGKVEGTSPTGLMDPTYTVNDYPGSDRERPKPPLNSKVEVSDAVAVGKEITAKFTKSDEDTELASVSGKWYRVVPDHDGQKGGDVFIGEHTGGALTDNQGTYTVTKADAACQLKFVVEGFDKDGNSLGAVSATTTGAVPKNACEGKVTLPESFVPASTSLQITDAVAGQEYTVVDMGEVVEEPPKEEGGEKEPVEGNTPASQADEKTPATAPTDYTWTKASGTTVTVSSLTPNHTYQVWVRIAETWNTLAGTAESAAETVNTTASSSSGIVIGGSKPNVTVTTPENGTITTDQGKNPPKGTVVTITVTPDEGYETKDVTVVDSMGKKLTVTKNEDGTYSFTMPGSSVKVSATFISKTQVSSGTFSDVTDDKWFAESVKYVVEHGLMVGTSESVFSPDAATTRGMIVTILYRLAGEPEVKSGPFTDVPAGRWYTNAVSWAEANGIVGGYGDGTFGPEDNITREQMAAILYRYARYMGYDVTGTANLNAFIDLNDLASYAKEATAWANASGLISGITETTLNPKGTATRAQVSMILMRFCENVVPSAE